MKTYRFDTYKSFSQIETRMLRTGLLYNIGYWYQNLHIRIPSDTEMNSLFTFMLQLFCLQFVTYMCGDFFQMVIKWLIVCLFWWLLYCMWIILANVWDSRIQIWDLTTLSIRSFIFWMTLAILDNIWIFLILNITHV